MIASPRVLTITLALMALVIMLVTLGIGALTVIVWRLINS
jgi:hypothetical protein